ncbi:MAG: VOC family protein [Candidatus Dormibacteria bacterium]|nr:glyoxalase [Chloroflexota bacterium]HBV94321.1 glyoxalase [Chloroflexota bacterium]
MPVRWQCVVVDCHDPERVARFWSAVFARPPRGPEDGEWWLELGEGVPDILFLAVPDTKVAKNRLHFDLRPADQAAEVARLLELGARQKDIGQGEVSWVVMADPEDNEFCVLRALPPTS